MRDFFQPTPLTPERPIGAAGPSRSEPIRFSLADVPERERLTRFGEFYASLGARCDVELLRDVPFEVDFTVQKLPGLMLMSGTRHGSRTHRSTTDGTDDVGLLVNLGGLYFMSQGRREIVIEEGEATLVSLADPGTFVHQPPGDVLALRFPRAQLASLSSGVEDGLLQRIPRQNPALRLLRDYVDVAWGKQSIVGRELQPLFVSHIYDLMALAIWAPRDAAESACGRGLRAARLDVIKQDIIRNLGRSDLSLTTLAARHGCTPRFIQRLFETEGTTFTDYVLAQRLACAHRLLSDPRRAAEKIAAIAYDAGFGDLSYFNRAFRRHYGAAPSEIRLSARRLDA
jgi:AraC-like DNA-binding protein